jgi:hypothetical protein
MITFNGVPVITYGLTGLMIALLTTMTFVDTKGQSSEIVATASVPSLVSNFLTPSAPSFIESVTAKISTPSIMGSLVEKPSIMESLTGKKEEPSIMESIMGKKEEPSILESLTGKKEEPSMLESIMGKKEEPSILEKITTPIARLVEDEEEDEGYIQRKGGSKKNKNKRKNKRTRKSK